MGYRKGVEIFKDLLWCCRDWGLEVLIVYVFFSENWGRLLEEVNFLMILFEKVLC